MRETALWLYQRLTQQRRQKLLSTLQGRAQVPVAILFYHRVADSYPNAWTIERQDFVHQLDWLQENYRVVSLAEAQHQIRTGQCKEPTASITFDDGYADNARFAIPELLRRGLTATYFVSTSFVREGRCFPHDERCGQPLPPNSIAELQEFSEQGIEIGAHTSSHADLGSLSDIAAIRAEIVDSAQELESWLGKRVRYFAFPFGLPENTSQLAVDVIREHGFDGFCTAYGAWNWPESEGFHLRRIHADPGIEKLKNWLTFDFRKLQDRAVLPFSEPVIPLSTLACPTA